MMLSAYYLLWLGLLLAGARALDNGLARTPPMGWLSWERYGCVTECDQVGMANCISETLYQTQGDALVSEGYAAVGYNFVNIDDCWNDMTRDSQGRLQANATRFPSGIAALADYMHKRKLKLGIYSSMSQYTCAGYPGVWGHLQTDAETFADWGVDSVKMDGCGNRQNFDQGYPEFGHYMNLTGRPMLYSCSWPDYERISGTNPNYTTVAKYCNLWRNYNDISDNWASVASIIEYYADNQYGFIEVAGPGAWNDPDQLIIGDFSLSKDEAQAQFGFWALFAAPLYISADLTQMMPGLKMILQNKEVIAVNQDPLGKQGTRISNSGGMQVWTRELANGDTAVILYNSNDSIDGSLYQMNVDVSSLGITGPVSARDLFLQKDLGPLNTLSYRVEPHTIRMFRLTATSLSVE